MNCGDSMKTTRRFEYKYIISYKDYYKIIDSVRSLLNHDQHGEDIDYPVHSIYLDDIYDAGAGDKAFGNQFHKKYRIRHYHNPSQKKLELKEKVGNISTKHSIELSNELYDGIVKGDLNVLEQHFEKELIRRFTLTHLTAHLTPRAYIKYHREAYKDKDDNLRLTFDSSLSVSRYVGDDEGVYIKLLPDTMLILEIKYEHYLPKEIKTILNQITLTQIAYSKYFLGYDQLFN